MIARFHFPVIPAQPGISARKRAAAKLHEIPAFAGIMTFTYQTMATAAQGTTC